ncbi:MAG: hypothetical protein D6752_04695, partial [Candidatus Nitrosothermus koennekii]
MLLDINNKNITRLDLNLFYISNPRFNMDADKIIFLAQTDSRSSNKLYLYDIINNSIKSLEVEAYADWLNNDEILYVNKINDEYQLVKMNINTLSKDVIYTNNYLDVRDYANGKILFIQGEDLKQIYVFDLNTKETRVVSDKYFSIAEPRFNDDASLIIFTENIYQGYGSVLHIIDLNTLEDNRLFYPTNNKAYYGGVFLDDKIVYAAEGIFGEFNFEWNDIKSGDINVLPEDFITYLKRDLGAYWIDNAIVTKNSTSITIEDNHNKIVIELKSSKAILEYKDKVRTFDIAKRIDRFGNEIITVYGPNHSSIYIAD